MVLLRRVRTRPPSKVSVVLGPHVAVKHALAIPTAFHSFRLTTVNRWFWVRQNNGQKIAVNKGESQTFVAPLLTK